MNITQHSFKKDIEALREETLTEKKLASLLEMLQDIQNVFEDDVYMEIAGALTKAAECTRSGNVIEAFGYIRYIKSILQDDS